MSKEQFVAEFRAGLQTDYLSLREDTDWDDLQFSDFVDQAYWETEMGFNPYLSIYA